MRETPVRRASFDAATHARYVTAIATRRKARCASCALRHATPAAPATRTVDSPKPFTYMALRVLRGFVERLA
ncbi:hypothetical protein PCAR4_170007 [Paraburkholderia caribensis]|nr:hypothetical protein PCAR4_170007 [Paraburkholderia caribensis]